MHKEELKFESLGPKSKEWLNAVGVNSRSEIIKIGAIPLYFILKNHGYNVSLNMVYALHAFINNTTWNKLSKEIIEDLKNQVMNYKS